MSVLCRYIKLISVICVLISFDISTAVAGSTSSTAYIKGTVRALTCTIADINVDFGNVTTTQIDGNSYKIQTIHPNITCEDLDSNSLAFAISGTTASFGSGLLATSVPGLGVQFKSNEGNIPLNSGKIDFDYTSSVPAIQLVLAKDSSVNLSGQDFTAAATLSVGYN
ncbi:fimbrial protein [Scandinavium goeteborgense]|uniref:fimbrial protein n=1 Tax=Scandinavium goeteborgense TaxID=1851514 RepID=UPI000F68FA85|nr:fimbrial protein [Scandinavium goeteborgense]QKN79774.1 hypothetical protein A8O29_000100 [Scandinavium goeteborgense]